MLTAVMDGPPGAIQVDLELVEVLLAQQHPNLATLPLRPAECGFDNYMFRLGESYAVRLPRSSAAARLLANTGVIDWGDMTSGDPAIDLACLWMLLPDETSRAQAQHAYGAAGNALWTRARGWAVLFGVMLLDTGLGGNARNAVMGEQILRRI